MKTNGVPAIIMLAAGFIDCVIAILTHMSLWNFTRQLLLLLGPVLCDRIVMVKNDH